MRSAEAHHEQAQLRRRTCGRPRARLRSARAFSPCVSPFADKVRTISATPDNRRCRLRTVCDSKVLQAPGTNRWQGGSGLPLGLLAGVRLYTTNADPRIEGNGHSPLCRHGRNAGLWPATTSLLSRVCLTRADFDWCSKCGGHAVRRLTGTQLSYYRAAHRRQSSG